MIRRGRFLGNFAAEDFLAENFAAEDFLAENFAAEDFLPVTGVAPPGGGGAERGKISAQRPLARAKILPLFKNNLLICSAGVTEQFAGAHCLGVGSLDAGLALAELIAKMRAAGRAPQEVLFVGSCGMYAKNAPLLGVYEFFAAANVCASELRGLAYRPEICEKFRYSAAASRAADAAREAAAGWLNSLEAISASEEEAERFAAAGFAAENMEAVGIFAASAKAGLKARCWLVAANHVGPYAHNEYLRNLAQIKRICQALVNFAKTSTEKTSN